MLFDCNRSWKRPAEAMSTCCGCCYGCDKRATIPGLCMAPLPSMGDQLPSAPAKCWAALEQKSATANWQLLRSWLGRCVSSCCRGCRGSPVCVHSVGTSLRMLWCLLATMSSAGSASPCRSASTLCHLGRVKLLCIHQVTPAPAQH